MKKPKILSLLILTLFLAWASFAVAENTADETVRASASDTTSGNLDSKLVAGTGINVSNFIPTGDQKLTISAKDKLTSKGDLLTHDASDDKTLVVGTDGQVLVVDSAASNGIKWADQTDLSAPGPIGDTTPSTGEFSTLGADEFDYRGLRKITFVLEVRNNSGTLQHRLLDLSNNTLSGPGAPTFVSGIAGLASAFGNTPVLSSSQDFVNGVGISSANSSALVFDYDVAQGLSSYLVPILMQDLTGNNLSIVTFSTTENVNGDTKNRKTLFLVTNNSAAQIAWNTTNIPVGKYIKILVTGYIDI
jgi:hypothetical protein